jgi:uroporphyrinogen III methyltransferase/synthase
MAVDKEKSLSGKRILVPPARPETNPLVRILSRKGAHTFAFPTLKVARPRDYRPMDGAIRELKNFDCVIFSGSNCVSHFMERLEASEMDKTALSDMKIVAIGRGALSALKKASVSIDLSPRVHTADGVIEELGDVSGRTFLLVRVEGASRKLPRRLQDLGAEITEVAGYRMEVKADRKKAARIFGLKPDILAFANPTAVRFFLKGVEDLGLSIKQVLEGVMVAAVGPATATAAEKGGIIPDLISKGHIADLAEELAQVF